MRLISRGAMPTRRYDSASQTALTGWRRHGQNAGMPPTIDLHPLRRALAVLAEAIQFWHAQLEGSALKPHLRMEAQLGR